MQKLLVPGTLIFVAACGGSPAGTDRNADFFVHATGVVVDSTAPFTGQVDFEARMENTLAAALEYWGGSWKDLNGRMITLEDAQYVRCGDSTHAIGCNNGDMRVSTRDPSVGTWRCIEETVLVHEVGHAVIGDPDHQDPRWMDFVPVLEQLDGREGYDDDGPVTCHPYLSVWRHVLNSR